MVAQSALAVVDGILEKANSSGAPPCIAVRMQAACIRALIDEVDCHPASSGIIGALQEQLDDEVNRLLELVKLH